MATYAAERIAWLAGALESVFAQTVAPDQLVLVIDGPVHPGHDEVIARYQCDPRIRSFELIRLPTNQGLANALNSGLAACTGEWTMRMDSDDVSHPARLRIQLDYAGAHPDIDVITSWIEEFYDGEDGTRLKSSPVNHDAVVAALRWRNILSHPSLLIRTESLRKVGGYRAEFGKLEDYDLFVRLSLAGARFHVIPAVLVRMRSGREQSARRGGWRYCLGEMRFRSFCRRQGFLNQRDYILTTAIYLVFRLIGPAVRLRLYRFARL